MMRKNIFGIFLFFLSLLLFLSCEKEENLSKSEILSKRPWIKISEHYQPRIYIIIDTITDQRVYFNELFDLYRDCIKDDIYNYNANGTFTWEEGESACYAGDPEVYVSGFWKISNNGNYLILNVGFAQVKLQIDELVENSLKYSHQVIDTVEDITYTITESFIYK